MGIGLVQIKVIYSKIGLMRYISHLDLNRLFQRALRRSGLPVAYTRGFNPRPCVSYKRALALGKISRSEEMVVSLTDELGAAEFKKRFQKELPKGIKIIKVIVH
ncbi:MAG: TIGR03936 family radical SAM-associated protein [Candidatus Omnitrophica bacterium]|nr:TIGR03936 family radical SAM-associated protein [Candidatus Omnitrophota bacterium]